VIPTGPAIVTLLNLNGDADERPAALVYMTPKGLGWLEPGYLDPFPPPNPQWHELEGQVIDTPDGLYVVTSTLRALVIGIDRPGSSPQEVAPGLVPNFEYLQTRLQELGTTIEAQRVRMAELLATTLQ
jgi:hypothetical protein